MTVPLPTPGMGEHEKHGLQQDIGQNKSTPTQQPFAMTPEEMAFSVLRAPRRTLKGASIDQDVNRSMPLNDFNAATGNIVVVRQAVNETNSGQLPSDWIENVEQNILTSTHRNNKTRSENLETLRENIKNNRDSLKKRSKENVLTIEQASRGRSRSIGTIDPVHLQTLDMNNSLSCQTLSEMNSTDSLNDSTNDLRSGSDTSGIDLLNTCRKFYFSHKKSLDGVKQSVRSAKHKRAMERVEGKTCTGLEVAMDRLSSEMVKCAICNIYVSVSV